MNKLNKVRTQGSGHNRWKGGLSGLLAGERKDRDERTGGHGRRNQKKV
jgi:hypothetical protein